MQSATFRKWLAEHGCRFDEHEHKRGDGRVLVTVHREGRKSEVPLGGSRQDLDPREVRRAARNSGSIGMNCLTSEPGRSFEGQRTGRLASTKAFISGVAKGA